MVRRPGFIPVMYVFHSQSPTMSLSSAYRILRVTGHMTDHKSEFHMMPTATHELLIDIVNPMNANTLKWSERPQAPRKPPNPLTHLTTYERPGSLQTAMIDRRFARYATQSAMRVTFSLPMMSGPDTVSFLLLPVGLRRANGWMNAGATPRSKHLGQLHL